MAGGYPSTFAKVPCGRARPAGTRSIRQAQGRLLTRRVRGVAARLARRTGDLPCNDHRSIARWRRRHAVRLPTSGLLSAADPDQQRWSRSRCRLDAATAVGARRRADTAGHRAATGSDRRQQAALVVRERPGFNRPAVRRCGAPTHRCPMRRPARRSYGRCDRWSTTEGRRSAH